MNQLLYQASELVFLAFPPLILGWRMAKPRSMPWWLLLPLVALVAWLASNAFVHFYYEHLGDELQSYGDNPPSQLLERWANDGAKRVFAQFFGWAYGLVYLVPWLAFYGAFQLVRRRRG